LEEGEPLNLKKKKRDNKPKGKGGKGGVEKRKKTTRHSKSKKFSRGNDWEGKAALKEWGEKNTEDKAPDVPTMLL